jgi:hypothetical protein
MAELSRDQVKELIVRTQHCFQVIQHESYDAKNFRYRHSGTAMWQMAVEQAVPPMLAEWREIIRVLAEGESYYGGSY